MSTVELFEAVVAGGIRDTHFFNGRMLTAGDLRTSQAAVVARDRQLGRAIGSGIASGLEVSVVDAGTIGTGARPVLRVTRGVGVSRRGDVLELTEDTDVALIRDVEARRAAAGEFAICAPPRTATSYTNFGLYVLTLAPASRFEGLAPMTELRTEGVGSACGRGYEVDGVRFGLGELDLGTASALGVEATQLMTELDSQLGQQLSGIPIAGLQQQIERKVSLLRSVAAHACLGTERRRRFAAGPFGSSLPEDAFDSLDPLYDADVAADCEVPVALLYWSVRGVEFVDMWAVRRQLASRAEARGPAVRYAAAIATWMQFQRHLEDLIASTRSVAPRIAEDFAFIPAAGLVTVTAAMGADGASFFEGLKTVAPVHMEGARLPELLRRALTYPPVSVRASDPPPRQRDELLWRYLIRENRQGLAAGAVAAVVFTTGHVPYHGDAHYDLAYFNFANYT